MEKQLDGKDRFLHYLGLAQRAGRVVSGTDAVARALAAGGVCLLIVAHDASERTARHWQESAAKAGVPILRAGTRVILGSAIGKSPKAVVAVTEEGLSAVIARALEQQEEPTAFSQANGPGGRSSDRSDA